MTSRPLKSLLPAQHNPSIKSESGGLAADATRVASHVATPNGALPTRALGIDVSPLDLPSAELATRCPLPPACRDKATSAALVPQLRNTMHHQPRVEEK